MKQSCANSANDRPVHKDQTSGPLARRQLLALLAALPVIGKSAAVLAANNEGDRNGMITNLLADLPDASAEEVFEPLLELRGVRLERITSQGQVTPEGDWYDQEQDEWVMVLEGAARLLVEGDGELDMGPGDSVFLPAHRRHRVTWTDPDQQTVWLALHVWPRNG
ncbi:MAG: cupin domain-containing protein [Pseudomonadota bacterium]